MQIRKLDSADKLEFQLFQVEQQQLQFVSDHFTVPAAIAQASFLDLINFFEHVKCFSYFFAGFSKSLLNHFTHLTLIMQSEFLCI